MPSFGLLSPNLTVAAAPQWSELPGPTPGERQSHVLVFDSWRARTIVHGGFDGADPRLLDAAVFDEAGAVR